MTSNKEVVGFTATLKMLHMRSILDTSISNGYQSHSRPEYDPKKGHTGIDLRYRYEPIPAPVNGKIVKIVDLTTNQMGKTIYFQDEYNSIHVFAHLSQFGGKVGDKMKEGVLIGVSGNTGTVTSNPHLHYEIITDTPFDDLEKKMTRTLAGFKGYNVDPIKYLTQYKPMPEQNVVLPWAKEAWDWALLNGLVTATSDPTPEFQRTIVVLHKYHQKFSGGF